MENHNTKRFSQNLEQAEAGISGYLASIRRTIEGWWSCPARLAYRGFASTQVGTNHSVNADVFCLRDDAGLYLIADGFGDGQDAEDAAWIGVGTFVERFAELSAGPCNSNTRNPPGPRRAKSILQESFAASADAVLAFRDLTGSPCGASLAAVYCADDTAVIGSIGSCRVYSLKHGRLCQLTEDDTIGAELRRAEGKPMARGNGRFDKLLSKHLGDGEKPYPRIMTHRLCHNERLLLLTDGIYLSIEATEIESIVRSEPTASTPACLITAARKAGSCDDCAAVVVRARSLAKIFAEDYDNAHVRQGYATVQCRTAPVA